MLDKGHYFSILRGFRNLLLMFRNHDYLEERSDLILNGDVSNLILLVKNRAKVTRFDYLARVDGPVVGLVCCLKSRRQQNVDYDMSGLNGRVLRAKHGC